jgi:4-hydroxyacetophenone monooxygenase
MQVTNGLREASAEAIEDAVRFSDPMVLRGLTFLLTGDETLAEIGTTTVEFGFVEAEAITDPAAIDLLQEKAANALKTLREQEEDEVSVGPMGRLRRSFDLSAGVEIADYEFEMWEEQSGIDPWARGIRWEQGPLEDRVEDFNVVVIGAGMGGLHAGVHLKRAGIPFTILERNSGVGGTWHQNRYPGARVDTPSRIYTHVYGVDFGFSGFFSPQQENERYFNWVADEFGVREHIRLDTTVESLVWREDEGVWEIEATGPDGPVQLRANGVISAVGFLDHPKIPDIDGLETFAGDAFHTARWPENLDLGGKRVAVVGTGSTGYQLVPAVVKEAEHTYLFQRSPNWCFEIPGYLAEYPPQATWLDRNVPFHAQFSRFRSSWLFGPANVRHCFEIDPDFVDEDTRSPLNKKIRAQRIAFIESKLGARPDLFEKMIPAQPPLSARPVLIDEGHSVFDMLVRDEVTLVTTPIKRVTEAGIETEDGEEIALDVIVLATGFRSNDFLWPMEVRGRDGRRLEELWKKDGPRAYLGAMAPGFPNLFMIYGPNTNTYAGGNPINFQEYVTRFALECFRGLIEQDLRTVDVTDDAYWRYNDELDRWQAFKIYMDPRAHSYFHNEHGRSPVNSTIDERKLWRWLRDPTGSDGSLPAYEGGPVANASEMHPRFGEDLIVS